MSDEPNKRLKLTTVQLARGWQPFQVPGTLRSASWPALTEWGNWYVFHDRWRKAARCFANPTVEYDEPLQKPDDVFEKLFDIKEAYGLGWSRTWFDGEAIRVEGIAEADVWREPGE